MNYEPKSDIRSQIFQRTTLLFRESATILKTIFGMICCCWLACGCGKVNGPATDVARLGTNQIGWVSIGVLNTVDNQRQQAVMRFFESNGILCFIEGSVMFDVMVRQSDVEYVHAFLKTNQPQEVAFRSAWENR